MDFMVWLPQDVDVTHVQVDSCEPPRQETGRAVQVPSSSDLSPPEGQTLSRITGSQNLFNQKLPAPLVKCHKILISIKKVSLSIIFLWALKEKTSSHFSKRIICVFSRGPFENPLL